ncbi:hypothetical protein [Candidatus Chloroploca asiatica]|uniref:Uncharacterized protein n=1 Tax=Candidatus Chloroploca asiatica TaxID=1506545 RepID=A0A2H3KGK8_9CHLR|nr:hypothetical protein [Candidatus Chloroploca asiatica]PDV96853.1 hypothetical protein A9Q02_20100 [Candidatus Chloroploca asiatica]
MAKTVILHLTGEDPILADLDDEPQPTDLFIKVSNMRRRDGKPVPYLAAGVQAVIFPWHRITFIELMPSEEERSSVVDFFRS